MKLEKIHQSDVNIKHKFPNKIQNANAYFNYLSEVLQS